MSTNKEVVAMLLATYNTFSFANSLGVSIKTCACYFSSSDRASKTMKNIFYFILKSSNVCNFLPSFPHYPDSKGKIEKECHRLTCINLHM